MTSIPVTKARSKLYQLLDAVAGSREPIQITGKRSNAVLVWEEDWRSRLVHVEKAHWSFLDDKDARPEICFQVEPIFYQWNRGDIYHRDHRE